MKSFRFPLDRILDWRRTQLELEELRMRQLHAELRGISESLSNLEECRREEQLALGERGSADGSELRALADYLKWWDQARRDLVTRHAEKKRQTAAHSERLLAARKRVRLIEHLRERRLTEWKEALRRETESFAAESHLARRRTPPTKVPPARRDAGNGA